MEKVTRRGFLKKAGIAAVWLESLSASVSRASAGPPGGGPNVVLVITDDQGYGDLGCHGNSLIDTPVLDRLGAEGARFERFFVSPVCAPTRASLLTGRYHLRTGVHGVTRGYENMRSEEVTIAEALKGAGYVTGCFGKWHNGSHYPYHPNGQGFDEFFGFCAGHWNNYFDTTLERNGREVRTKGFISDVLTDAAIGFIEKNRGRPFFCYVPYNAPHGPFQVPDKYFDKYKGRGLDDRLACIYGMVENVDDNVGRILRRLDELGLSEKTIVIFLTDNGPNSNRYNGGMKGRKGSVHEGGIRVPLFIRFPGRIKAGTKVERIAGHIDMFATVLDLCGLEMPRTLGQDGRSLVPLLDGRGEDWADRMIFTFRSPGGRTQDIPGSVRTQRWRAVRMRSRWELYDMEADPGQKRDVAGEHRDVVERLGGAYEKAVAEVTKGGFDQLPFHIGYRERPVVTMPGHEAFLEQGREGGISYVGRSGWANDWVTNWTSTEAYPRWEVEVVEGGRYEVTLMYVCAKANVGCRVRVEAGGRAVEAVVERAHDPAPIASPDRVPRGEVYEKVWAPLRVGVLDLAAGRTQLIVRAVEIRGGRAMDLKAVQVKRVD